MHPKLRDLIARASAFAAATTHRLSRLFDAVRTFVQENIVRRKWQSTPVGRLVVGGSDLTYRKMQAVWVRSRDVALRLQIRLKLSLIVAVAVVGTTLVISTIAINLQERELRLQTQVLGTQLVQSLTAVAEDNLLLNSIPVLQDYVKNFNKQSIPGLVHLYVMDRTGTIVAHVVSDSVNVLVRPEEFDMLANADSAISIESETEFRFIHSIHVTRREGGVVSRFLLGGASASFSKATLLAPIDEMRQTIILTSFGVAVFSIGLMYLVSKRIVHVIIVLSDAARRVGAGDLKVSVLTKSMDEIGMLAREFNLMVVQIREKVEMSKFVSKSLTDAIAGGGEVKLGGSRKSVVILFTDIRNFTSYSEKHWPEEVVDTLNTYLDIQTRVIHGHKGVVDKFIGDGVMSIFTGPDMARNAIEAAIHIQRDISGLNAQRKKAGEPVLHVGIGIASGAAVLGSIGSQDRMDFTAIGDTVNLSSRLCGLAGPEEIFVTGEVAKRTKELFPSRSEGSVPIKGKKEEVPVFRIPYSLTA